MTAPVDAGRAGARVVTVLLLGSTLTVMAGAILAPVLDLVRRDLALGPTTTGLVLTVHGLSLALSGPFVGRVIDRHGTRPVLALGMVVYGLAGGAGLVTEDLWSLLASRLVFGVGAGAVFTGTTVALLELFDGPRRDRVMGWRASAISAGGVVWPLLGGALGTWSWHGPFAVYLLGLPLGAATWLLLPRSASSTATATRGTERSFAVLRRTPGLAPAYLVQVLGAVLLYAVLILVPLRLAQLGVTAPLVVAIATAGLSAAMAASSLGYARARGRSDDRTLVRITLVLWSVSLAGLGLASVTPVLVAAAVVFGVGMGLAVPAVTSWVADAAPAAFRGTATSLLATATFGGQLAAPLLLGPLVGATSIRTGFVTCAVLSCVGGALVGLVKRGPSSFVGGPT